MAMNSKKMRCLGIMNGTSLDGADFVLIEVDTTDLSCRYLETQSFNFGKKIKNQLLAAAQHKLKVDELALLHHELGRYYADCFLKLNADMKNIEVIGLHGQTVFHRGGVATMQIGEPSYIAAVSKANVVSDFRAGDMALGGQGAPIATFFHQCVFGQKNKVLSVHNLGGISNLSLLVNAKLTAGFDTGPANMLIDMAMKISSQNKKQFDKDGAGARKGKPSAPLVFKMMKHKFFKKKPPKSCGREEFGELFYNAYKKELQKLSLHDRLATLSNFVAVSIAEAYENYCEEKPEEIIFCGGGAHNKFLLEQIGQYLPHIKISSSQDYGWPVQSIEGAAFALLAAAKILGRNSNLPDSTGADRLTSLGKITRV
jgi:anhydro-N-acetylmuramic acid kinase